jgi:hypothetical protein
VTGISGLEPVDWDSGSRVLAAISEVGVRVLVSCKPEAGIWDLGSEVLDLVTRILYSGSELRYLGSECKYLSAASLKLDSGIWDR